MAWVKFVREDIEIEVEDGISVLEAEIQAGLRPDAPCGGLGKCGKSIEDISEDIMGVVLPQYSEKKRKIYEASKLYFEALTQAKSQEDIDRLGKRLAELEAEYSENPAYMAWVHQQYLEQKWKVKKNETNK